MRFAINLGRTIQNKYKLTSVATMAVFVDVDPPNWAGTCSGAFSAFSGGRLIVVIDFNHRLSCTLIHSSINNLCYPWISALIHG